MKDCTENFIEQKNRRPACLQRQGRRGAKKNKQATLHLSVFAVIVLRPLM